MPLSRYQIRNEYSLADPELYRAADKDDPEALLEGVAMAGLVGVLRQLGDLAEFAAEIFHDLHEEVMVTAARGHGLLVRIQQLESEFPSIERAFLSQTGHSAFFSNSGTDWHPNLQTQQNLITRGDLPRFVMDSYEECRGPPRLFLLDKFDVAGAGACLKRYTDPSYYKVEASNYEMAGAEAQRDKKIRKTKKKGPRWKNGETLKVVQTSHAKLHQLFLEERVHNGASEPTRRVKLKKRPNKVLFRSESGKSYMEKLLNSPTEDKLVPEVPVGSSPLRLPSDNSGGSGLEILEISTVGSASGLVRQSRSPYGSPIVDETVSRRPTDNLLENIVERRTSELPTSSPHLKAGSVSFGFQEEADEKHIAVDGEFRRDSVGDGYQSDDVASETDNFVDALTTMESEIETDIEFRAKTDPSLSSVEKQERYSDTNADQPLSQFSDSQSIGNSTASDDGNTSIRKGTTNFSPSDTTSSSADNVSLGVGDSPQPFGLTEIPFRPRISSNQVSVTENVPVTQHPEQEDSNDNSIEVSEIPSHRVFSNPALPVDQGTMPTESTLREADLNQMTSNSKSIDSPRKAKEHQIYLDDALPSTSKLSEVPLPTTIDHPYSSSELSDVPSPTTTDIKYTSSFVRNSEGEVDDEDRNASSNPVIHLPDVSKPTYGINENSLSKANQAEYREDNRNWDGSQCSSPHSVISHVEGQPVGPSFSELDICDPDVKPSEVANYDGITPVEENADSHHTSSSGEWQLKEIGDDIRVHEPDSGKAGVPCFSEDGTELVEREKESVDSENKAVNAALFVPGDFHMNGDNDPSALESERELEERETVSVDTETEIVAAAVSVLTDVDGNECTDLSSLEDDTGLKEREAESINSETEAVTADVSIPVDVGKNEDNGLSTLEEPDQNGLVINDLCLLRISDESDEKKEVGQQSVLLPELESIPCDTAPFDHSNMQFLDGTTNASMAACGELDQNDISNPSANLKILQNGSQSILQEPDQNGQQRVVSPDLKPQLDDVVACDHSNVQWLDGVPDSSMSAEAEKSVHFDATAAVCSSSKCIDHDLESKSPTQGDQVEEFEAASSFSNPLAPLEEKVDQPIGQPHMQSLAASGESSQLLSEFEVVDSQNHVDHEIRLATHSEPSTVNFASQPLKQEEELHGEPCDVGLANVVVPTNEAIDLREDVCTPESCSAPVSEGLPILELPQANLSDQVLPFTPVFSGFGVLPQLAPINLEEMPPLPPLPPMQWRMGKLQNASVTPRTYGGQDGIDHFPPNIPSKANEEPQTVGYPSLDGNRNPSNALVAVLDTEDRESQHACEDLGGKMVNSSQILSASARLDTEEDNNSSITSEVKAVKSAENVISQPASESEESQNVSSIPGREIFWPSSTSSFPAVDDERPNGIRPMKVQRPRSPLIDAVAAHDKSKLRKVPEQAKPQMPKEEERDTFLEQIRAKSFNLKPAIQTRPSIQGPNTNLRVAAILEKANAIRQALAGSDDDDDDDDSWSDS